MLCSRFSFPQNHTKYLCSYYYLGIFVLVLGYYKGMSPDVAVIMRWLLRIYIMGSDRKPSANAVFVTDLSLSSPHRFLVSEGSR